MILELAIGDAYGAGFEYTSKAHTEKYNDLSGYAIHPRHNLGGGRYTDDTQMTLAIVEIMLSGDWREENIAAHFVSAFHRDPREGYAGRFYEFLKSVETGQAFLDNIIPKSDKSGASMRAVPIGLLPTIESVIEASTIQAAVTHNTPDGINAAVATSLMAHYFAKNLGPKSDLSTFLVEYVPGEWDLPWVGKVGAKGWMSVRSAITAIQEHDSLSEMLIACVNYLGDVDTVATIALGVASLCPQIDQDLPQVLLDQLEDGPFGREYLLELDEKLVQYSAMQNSP